MTTTSSRPGCPRLPFPLPPDHLISGPSPLRHGKIDHHGAHREKTTTASPTACVCTQHLESENTPQLTAAENWNVFHTHIGVAHQHFTAASPILRSLRLASGTILPSPRMNWWSRFPTGPLLRKGTPGGQTRSSVACRGGVEDVDEPVPCVPGDSENLAASERRNICLACVAQTG